MKNLNLNKIIGLMMIIMCLSINCKKDETNVAQYIKNKFQGTPGVDGLQGYFKNNSSADQIYIYGSFGQDGNPDLIKSMVVDPGNSDTTFNILFDSQFQVSIIYLTLPNGLKEHLLYQFDWQSSDQFIYNIYDYNWSTKEGSLLYSTKITKNGENYNSEEIFIRNKNLKDSWLDGWNISRTTIQMAFTAGMITAAAIACPWCTVAGIVIGLTDFFSEAKASDELPSEVPPNPTEEDPKENLPDVKPCDGVNVNFNANMDENGSLAVFGVIGGVPPYTYSVNNSAFQENPVFNGPYTSGSFTFKVKDANGCIGVKVLPLPVVIDAYSVEKLSGDNQQGKLGQALSNPIKVLVKDIQGYPFAGAKVNFIANNGGSVSQVQVTTGVDGTASVTWTLGNTDEVQTLSVHAYATDGSTELSSSPLTFTSSTNFIEISNLNWEHDPGPTPNTCCKFITITFDFQSSFPVTLNNCNTPTSQYMDRSFTFSPYNNISCNYINNYQCWYIISGTEYSGTLKWGMSLHNGSECGENQKSSTVTISLKFVNGAISSNTLTMSVPL